ncbi:MAG: adenosine kinase [Pseudomonadota bacterium]
MSKENPDIVGIGNAIVDVLSKTDDAFLHANEIHKGSMTLIGAERADILYSKVGATTTMSGGSAANTVVAFASLGGHAGYIGKVAEDQLGEVFRQDIRSTHVVFDTPSLQAAEVPTSRCLIMITPDAQRTMCTFLGASVRFGPADLDEGMIKNAKATYLEGYLFDGGHAKKSFRMAAEIAHAAGKKIALTLSDPFCVERHRGDFLELIRDHVDILFGNEAEIQSLYGTDRHSEILRHCSLTVITKGAKGSMIVSKEGTVEIKATPVPQVVDTTGAGDIYAAGFLYGYTQNKPLKECGHIASVAAAEIISQVGARPQRSLAKVLQEGKRPE